MLLFLIRDLIPFLGILDVPSIFLRIFVEYSQPMLITANAKPSL